MATNSKLKNFDLKNSAIHIHEIKALNTKGEEQEEFKTGEDVRFRILLECQHDNLETHFVVHVTFNGEIL